MPTLTIDGHEVNVEPGTTVIDAADKLGIYIPRYCYHPGLSIAGSCRMCMVEVENIPVPQIACNTHARDGMVVSTDTEKIKSIRRHMLEFLLSNHPLDCPVCDQSGECDLQNFYMDYGRYQSRFLENKIKNKKAYSVGPHVMLDQERCILCSRCIRFTEEISKTHELGIFNRGNRSVVDVLPGKSLDNAYSGNVIDICPVGALTETQFRFQCRVWYLSRQDSICTGCSRGCNIAIDFNGSGRGHKAGGKRVQRLKPRYNPKVNQWWICDEGRFGFDFIDNNRIEYPSLQRGSDLVPSDWETALSEISKAIKAATDQLGPDSIGVIASPKLSNEELYLIKKLFGDLLGVSAIASQNPWETPGFEDDFLIRADRNPNSKGADKQGLTADTKEILKRAASGEIKVLYIFQHSFEAEEAEELLEKVDYIVFHGTNWNRTALRANVVLPGATHAEKDGTFTNCDGLVQRFHQALLPIEAARPEMETLIELATRLGLTLDYALVDEVFSEITGKTFEDLDPFGEPIFTTKGASAE